MLGQVFELSDIPTVAVLTFLEILLSADNAIVLSLISSSLPENLRKKALFIGMYSAFIFRGIVILCVAFLLKYPLIQLVGAGYLIYLSLQHLLRKKNEQSSFIKPQNSFWKTVLLIELFDLVFAVDSIVAGIAFLENTSENITTHPKLWIVYVGGMLGVFTIRYAAHLFTRLNEKFPHLEVSAHLMIGWIGLKLALQTLHLTFPYFPFIFWAGLIFLLAAGFIKRKKSF